MGAGGAVGARKPLAVFALYPTIGAARLAAGSNATTRFLSSLPEIDSRAILGAVASPQSGAYMADWNLIGQVKNFCTGEVSDVPRPPFAFVSGAPGIVR